MTLSRVLAVLGGSILSAASIASNGPLEVESGQTVNVPCSTFLVCIDSNILATDLSGNPVPDWLDTGTDFLAVFSDWVGDFKDIASQFLPDPIWGNSYNRGTINISAGHTLMSAHSDYYFDNESGGAINVSGGMGILGNPQAPWTLNFLNRGILRVRSGGIITNDVYFANQNLVSIAQGSAFHNQSSGDLRSIGAGARIEVSGSFLNTGKLHFSRSGMLSIYNQAVFQNEGSIGFIAGGTLSNDGEFFNRGSLILDSNGDAGAHFNLSVWNRGAMYFARNSGAVLKGRELNFYNTNGGVVNNLSKLVITDEATFWNQPGYFNNTDRGEVRVQGGTFNNNGFGNAFGSVVNDGVFLVEGTVINKGAWQNNGAFYNRSSGLLNNMRNFVNSSAGELHNYAGSQMINSGVIENKGLWSIELNGHVENTGYFQESPGSANFLGPGSIVNTGTIINAGDFDNHGTFVNTGFTNNTGTIAISDGARLASTGIFENRGTINNNGTIDAQANGPLRNFSLINTQNELTVWSSSAFENSGALNVLAGTFWNNGSTSNTGSIDVSEGGRLRNTGTFENRGTIDNRGTLDAQRYGSFHNRSIINTQNELTVWSSSAFENSGALNVLAGTFWNNGSASNTGIVDISEGSRLINTGSFENEGTINNRGTIDAQRRGPFHNRSVINNQNQLTVWSSSAFENTGVLNVLAGTFWNNGFTNNTGSIDISEGGRLSNTGTLDNSGSITNNGAVSIATGHSLRGTGSYRQIGGQLTVNGSLTQNSVNIEGGTIGGQGVINSTVSLAGAELGPGNSPGILAINGDFGMDQYSALTFELGGTQPGSSGYDVLNIAGAAFLAGELKVQWYDLGGGLFNAGLGDSFDLLSADSISGSFDLLSFAGLGNGLAWELNPLIDEFGSLDVLRLSVVSQVPLPGAAWLFGSALMGLTALRQRRRLSTS